MKIDYRGCKTKIDYTEYMKKNKRLSDMGNAEKWKIASLIKKEMQKRDVHGHVDITYYEDAALVKLNGEYYNVWDYAKSVFFKGFVGDWI